MPGGNTGGTGFDPLRPRMVQRREVQPAGRAFGGDLEAEPGSGRAATAQRALKAWRQALMRTGITNFRWHDFESHRWHPTRCHKPFLGFSGASRGLINNALGAMNQWRSISVSRFRFSAVITTRSA